MRVRSWLGLLLAISLLPVVGSLSAQTAPPRPAQVAPAEFGEPFPTDTYKNLNPGSGPETIDLANTAGKKPIVFFYWIPGNPRADSMFQQLQALATEVGTDKLALFGVVYPQPGRGADVILARARELKIQVPLLEDKGFKIGQRVRVQTVPNISILDSAGKLRLANGASLLQVLEYKINLEQGIRRVAEKGSLGTYGYLARYHPVTELIGKECPDVRAPLIKNSVEQRLHNMLKAEQLNVLIFWSVDCPHCRQSLPEWNAWLKENSDGINVVSAAKVTNAESKAKTKEFCDLNGFVFPTLMDQDLSISRLYKVTTTPTVLIIGPDRVVDSVLPVGSGDFGRKLYEKKIQLLKRPST